jgi:hypothetical protein
VVEDKVCPICTLNGQADITREASFPYVDGGAICNDNIDGSLPPVPLSTVDVTKTGVYTVEYFATDGQGNTNYEECCSSVPPTCGTENFCCRKTVRTITIQDTLAPVIALRYQDQLINAPKREDSNPATWFGKDHAGRVAAREGTPEQSGNPFLWGNMMEETPGGGIGFMLAPAAALVGLGVAGVVLRSRRHPVLQRAV